MTPVKLTTVDSQPSIRRTGCGRYEVRRHTADDGYVTYRIYVDGAPRHAAEIVYERDIRPHIAAHIDSRGATWHPHLVHTTNRSSTMDKIGSAAHDGHDMSHAETCRHEWVAGIMIVHPEDLAMIAAERTVNCSKCGQRYDSGRPTYASYWN